MTLSIFLKYVGFSRKACLKFQKISVRSQNWCLTIPKLVPDNPKTGACWSQNWCLMISRHHFWDCSEIPNMMPDDWLYRWVQLVATGESDLSSSVHFQHVVLQKPSVGHPSLSGIIFGISEPIPEIMPDNRLAPFLGPPSNSFGMVRHQFWYRQAPVLVSSGTSFGIVRHQFWDLMLIFRIQKGVKTV